MLNCKRVILSSLFLGSFLFGKSQELSGGILSVFANRQIAHNALNGGKAFDQDMALLSLDTNFSFRNPLHFIHLFFVDSLSSRFDIELIEVPNNYIICVDKRKRSGSEGLYESYLSLPVIHVKKIKKEEIEQLKACMEKTKIDTIDYLFTIMLSYKMIPFHASGGFGSAIIQAHLTLSIINMNTSSVIKINEYAHSDQGLTLIKGMPIVNALEIESLCYDATKKVSNKIVKEMPRLKKKLAKIE